MRRRRNTAVPGCRIELHHRAGGAMIVAEPLRVDADGTIAIPQQPGLGVDVDWQSVDAHGVLLD